LSFSGLDLIVSGKTILSIQERQCSNFYRPLPTDSAEEAESEEVSPGIILDFDENNQVVGIEMLRVQSRVPLANLKQLQFEVA